MEMASENQKENEIRVDRKSKIFFSVFAVLIIAAVGVTYWRYMIKRDYIVQAQIDCDPTTENCFIWHCDPNSLEPGEECTGVPDNDTWYYKVFYRNAKNIPDCDPKDESCTAYVCGDGEKDCSYELCTPRNVKKGEECNDPVKYNEENPPTEDGSDQSSSCAPDDTECQNAADTSEQCDPNDTECQNASQDNAAECDPTMQDCSGASNNQDQSATPDNTADSQNNDSGASQDSVVSP